MLISGVIACTPNQNIIIEDTGGDLGRTRAPVAVELNLDESQVIAARGGLLAFLDPSADNIDTEPIPVQLDKPGEGTNSKLVIIMPEGEPGPRKLMLVERDLPCVTRMNAYLDPVSGQVVVKEDGETVLQYIYKTICDTDVVPPIDEKLLERKRIKRETHPNARNTAVPRSDYIHPLYGLQGEMLTRDWVYADGHPHHRGIFWAWPEVEYGSERGDIYALQRIFARPSGRIEFINGPVFSQIIAENLWMWEDSVPILREYVSIRVYRATSATRIVDIALKLAALEDSITIATRNTDSYGSFNLRMMTPENQDISYFTDKPDAQPRRAWSDFNGIFEGAESTSGLMVLQHRDNPEYPGAWDDYPNLAWVQPTFPTPGTRYPLSMEAPLVLRYRLIIHSGGKPDDETSKARWDAYHETQTPLNTFN